MPLRSSFALTPLALAAFTALAAGCGAPPDGESTSASDQAITALTRCQVGYVSKCTVAGCVCVKQDPPPPPPSPVTLTSATTPTTLQSDATNLYWFGGAGVMQCAKASCVPQTLYAGQVAPGSLVVDATNVYWLEANNPRNVYSCAIGGCGGAPTVLLSGLLSATSIAVDATSVYVLTDTYESTSPTQPPVQHPSSLYACAKSGCGNAPTLISGTLGIANFNANALAVANGTLYAGYGDGVVTCGINGCATPGTLFTGFDVWNLTIANGALYALSAAANDGVVGCSLSGCGGSPTVLTTMPAPTRPLGLAVDGTGIYWTAQTRTPEGTSDFSLTSQLNTCPLSGCATPQTLVSYGSFDTISPSPVGVTLDATYAYFTVSDGSTGSLDRIVK